MCTTNGPALQAGLHPHPRWDPVRADGGGLRSLPQLDDAADPIDWLP
jgi:hypothetical protein